MIVAESNMPWVLLGDCNALSSTEDRIGASVRISEIAFMLECMSYCQISDVKANGRLFTWNNK